MSLATNYDDVLDQLQSYGLEFRQSDLPLEIGRMRRVRVDGEHEKKGWYILHELPMDDGEILMVGSFGIWRGQDNGAQKVELKKRELSTEQKAALKSRLAEDRKRAAHARKADAERAARRAEAAWHKCQPTWTPDGGEPISGNSYLLRKQVRANGARFTSRGALVVPMMDANSKVHGLQFVLPKDTHAEEIRKNDGKDKKYWPFGLTKQGNFFLIGSPDAAGIVLIAEGFATASTLHEASGLPVAVAFDAGNLQSVGTALRKRYKRARILFCADDDAYGKCPGCKKLTPQPAPTCAHCGADTQHMRNAGVSSAELTALAVPNSAVIVPQFPDPEARRVAAMERGVKITDFNDLHVLSGLPTVRGQIEVCLAGLNWKPSTAQAGALPAGGAGEGEMPSQLTVYEAVSRYYGTYGLGGDVLFDKVERRLVHKKDVVNLLPRHGWDDLRTNPNWKVVRDIEVGFDPTEKDQHIKANLFGGWPTTPKAGECTVLLHLLRHLCSNESNGDEIYRWLLKWLAYPIQHRGAKMQSAVVVHGGQGTGKSRFFEAYAMIFGQYGRVLGQEALEDKFNADWAEKKLFIVADEVLARQDMYHIKNRLKGFITGDTIRVNPKNVAAHNEKNQMNIVFLSNERQPLVLEDDDRRHMVIWVPPKLDDRFFIEVNEEIDNGGVAALHHYLLGLDLGDFRPWTKPPMSKAKQDLVELGRSSEERFIREWIAGEIDGPNGEPLPFCPCLGSHLYIAYGRWCDAHGERKRGAKDLISLAGKLPGWQAGQSMPTWTSFQDRKTKNRKMVVPSKNLIDDSAKTREGQIAHRAENFNTKAEWLTNGYFAFERSIGA